MWQFATRSCSSSRLGIRLVAGTCSSWERRPQVRFLRRLVGRDRPARVAPASRRDYPGPVVDPRGVFDRLTAAQNAHDVDAMVACLHDDYRSEQPIFPARAFGGRAQVRANWSAILDAIPDFRGEVLREAVDGDTIFAEVHWTGTKANGEPLDE